MSAFSQLSQQWQQKYQGLSANEKKLVSIFVPFSLLFFLVVGIYQPLMNSYQQTQNQLKQQLQTETWAKQQIAIIKSSGKTTVSHSGSITQQINNTASQFKIRLTRIQPQGDSLVKVGVPDVSFNTLIQWLAKLQQQGISVANIDFTKADASGIVQVRRLDLER